MKRTILLLIFQCSTFLAWNYFGLIFILSVAIIIGVIADSINLPFYKYYLKIMLFILSLNISATSWLLEVSLREGVLAYVENTLLMMIPITLVYFVVKVFKTGVFIVLLPIWILFEISSHYWLLPWPWLTFGNVMSNQYFFIQWYKIFGVFAGTLWLLLLGNLSYMIISKKEKQIQRYILFVLFLIIPICASLFMFYSIPANRDSEISVTTYIPNDSRVSNLKKTQKLYNYVTKNQVSNIILSPELFLTSFKISSQIEHANHYFIRRLIKLKPNTAFFAGAEIIDDDSRRFNAMMVINEKGNFYRIKRKYVPIREHVPKYLKFAFGESFYSRCENDDQRIISKLYGIFPVLCYESIFSTYIVKNVEDNNLIFLSTSEEFMNNSYFGKKLYLDIVRLRAIETNRNVIKCSNKGYSCVINEKGAITTRITEEYQNVIAYKIENHSIYQKLIKSS